jgi:hypothetical protein
MSHRQADEEPREHASADAAPELFDAREDGGSE